MKQIRLLVNECQCPKCGAKEMHEDGERLQVRGFKVEDEGVWWSQCLVCSGGYDKINGEFVPERHNDNKGWFRS